MPFSDSQNSFDTHEIDRILIFSYQVHGISFAALRNICSILLKLVQFVLQVVNEMCLN